MTSEVSSRSNAKIAKKIGRAPDRKKEKEQAWRELPLTEPTEAPQSLAAPSHRMGSRAVGAEGGRGLGAPM